MNTKKRALARTITVSGEGGKFSLKIDGEEFPWYISEEGVMLSVRAGIPQITISIMADRIISTQSGPGVKMLQHRPVDEPAPMSNWDD